jgi:hypothetical protein
MRDPCELRAELLHLRLHGLVPPDVIRRLEIEVAWIEHELGWDVPLGEAVIQLDHLAQKIHQATGKPAGAFS